MSSLKTPPKLRRLLNELPENAGRIVGSLKDVEEASISTRDVIVSHDSIDTSTLYRSFDELRESIHNDWHGLISVLCLLKSAVNYVRQDKNGEIYKDGSWNAPVSSEWNDVQDSAKLIAVRFATTYKAIFIPFSRFLLTQPKRFSHSQRSVALSHAGQLQTNFRMMFRVVRQFAEAIENMSTEDVAKDSEQYTMDATNDLAEEVQLTIASFQKCKDDIKLRVTTGIDRAHVLSLAEHYGIQCNDEDLDRLLYNGRKIFNPRQGLGHTNRELEPDNRESPPTISDTLAVPVSSRNMISSPLRWSVLNSSMMSSHSEGIRDPAPDASYLARMVHKFYSKVMRLFHLRLQN